MNEKKYFEFLSWYLNGVEQKRYNLHKILPQDAVKLYLELKQPQVINSVCKCPLCGEKMKGIELTHYKCKKCNEYFTN